MSSGNGEPVFAIRDLVTRFDTPDGEVKAVDGVSYELHRGETLGVVGESGSGKSVTVMTALGLIPQPPGRVEGGEALLEGTDLLQLPREELRKLRGGDIAMIFQDPMTSLNPVLKVGYQIDEALKVHNDDLDDDGARDRTIELLDLVGVPNARERANQFPHEYSGGMRQRAMIAMAIANEPKVLIADEPTTALDVTIQAQVLDVLKAAQDETGAATVMITHDLAVIAEVADRVVVMYAGKIVESGTVTEIFREPRHPYTLGLLASLPRLDSDLNRLASIPGQPPSLINRPSGCSFHPRCPLSQGRARCREEVPPLYDVGKVGDQHAACHFHDEMPAYRKKVEQDLGGRLAGSAS